MLNLSEDQKRVLEMALEFYIRLGLGQFSQIALRLNLIHGNRLDEGKLEKINQLCEEMEEIAWGDDKPWNLKDDDTSLYTLNAFLLEVQMAGRGKETKWAKNRIEEIEKITKEKIQ